MPKEIVLENEGLIYSLSNKFYGVEKEDLIQAGFLGLTKAYRNYDENRNVKFSTYAYGFIYGEMYETATGNRPIHINKSEMRLYKGVKRTKELLETKYERPVSYEEACAYLKVDFSLFTSILNSLSAFVSFDANPIDIPKRSNVDDMILLKESLKTLTPIERDVIKRRYLDDLSQDETAKTLGLSQVKVSRIEKKSREKMRNFIAS